MLSLARYRFAWVAQFSFLSVNGLGLLMGSIYNSKTPDLYEDNIHHTLGWVVTVIVSVQWILGFVKSNASDRIIRSSTLEEQIPFIPRSVDGFEDGQSRPVFTVLEQYRYSHDSGQGTEASSSRSHSISSQPSSQDQQEPRSKSCELDLTTEYGEKGAKPYHLVNSRILVRVLNSLPNRVVNVIGISYDVIDRLILLLGFVLIVSGAAVYGGVFVSFPCQSGRD